MHPMIVTNSSGSPEQLARHTVLSSYTTWSAVPPSPTIYPPSPSNPFDINNAPRWPSSVPDPSPSPFLQCPDWLPSQATSPAMSAEPEVKVPDEWARRCNKECWEHLCKYLKDNRSAIESRKRVRCIPEQYRCPHPCRGKPSKGLNDDWAAIVKQVNAEKARDDEAIRNNDTRQILHLTTLAAQPHCVPLL